MRISHKIILTVVIVITVSALSDFFKIQNGIELADLFDELIESETPSLTSLIEIKSSARQASLKAVEYSIHGNKKDKSKALEAIEKIKHHVSNYTTLEAQDHRTVRTDLNDLNTLVNQFILTTEDYLKISEGPSLSRLNLDESKLHKSRKNLIGITKNISTTHDKLILEKIKSEARKVSLKSIEFYLRGIPHDKNKAVESIAKLNKLVNDFDKANNKSNTNVLKQAVSAYTESANYYLNEISERKAPVSRIYAYEEELNKSRKTLIHTLYDLIKTEQAELASAASQAKSSISSLINTTIIAAFILTFIIISMGTIIYRSISKPITHLINATKDIGSGNFEGRINIKTSDEIKVLADAFNEMTRNIQSSQLEREKALQALEDREQDLAITLDSIGDAVITTDSNGMVTRMNPVAEKLTGWSLKDAKNNPLKTIFPIINATTRKKINNPVDIVISTGETVFLSNHTTLIAKDGTEYQIADSAAPIRNSNNDIQGMVLIFNDVTEQYHMREEIRLSEQQLKLYREQTPLATIEWSIDFEVIDWNKAAEKMFGYTLEEVKGKNFADIMLPKNVIVDIKELWENLISQKGGMVSINENLTKSGDIILCEWHNTPLIDKSGNVIGAASIVLDITIAHRAQLALQESEQDLAITLNSIGDAVITTDSKGNITRMNPVAEQLTGWTIDEAKNIPLKTVFPIINATTREPIQNPVDKVLATGEIVYLSNHTTLISKSGNEFQIADSAAPIRNTDNSIIGMVLVFNDVTEQYKLRQSASKNRRDLQAIMDNSPAVIYVKDLEGHFTFINQQFRELFNVDNKTILGKTLHDIFPKEIADEMQKNDIDVLETGHALESEEIAPQEDGPHTYVSTKFPLLDDDDNIYAICGISTDVTERKLQDEQLRRSQKMEALGKLTGGIAHDYNNMLGVILGYSELLQIKLSNEPDLISYIKEIHRAGERGAKLTKKLLTFSRQKSSENKVVQLNEILKDSRLMLEKTMTARINLELNLSDDLWPISIDVSDFEDAILNMSINSMHAIENNGKLTIQTRNEVISDSDAQQLQIDAGDYVLFSLTDTGNGMSKEIKEKVFDPFFSTKGERGTGLGLTQVYGFIQRSHGAINLYSEPGHGTRFTLYFPRAHDNVNEEPIQNNTQPKDLYGTETILIVDDEPALINVTSQILEQHGYNCLSANNGKQALKTLANQKIDILLTDVIMPEMDGYELAAIVQKEYPDIKIQMASGFSDDRHLNMTDDSLHKNLLNKPYHSSTLLKRISELVKS